MESPSHTLSHHLFTDRAKWYQSNTSKGEKSAVHANESARSPACSRAHSNQNHERKVHRQWRGVLLHGLLDAKRWRGAHGSGAKMEGIHHIHQKIERVACGPLRRSITIGMSAIRVHVPSIHCGGATACRPSTTTYAWTVAGSLSAT